MLWFISKAEHLGKNIQGEFKTQSKTQIKEEIISALLKLPKKYSNDRQTSKAGNVKECSFSVEKVASETGICTYFGACRFHGEDYMFQGGCGEESNWGTLTITNPMECIMMVSRRKMVEGICTKSGHCWAGHHIKLMYQGC